MLFPFRQQNLGEQLTPSLQTAGRKRYVWFTRLNTISFASLGESILILYAIKNGADDFLVGLISSLLFLTLPLMVIGKNLIGKFGAARAYGLSWFFRNLSAAMLILVPILSHYFGVSAGLLLLVISAFGFFGFRSVGFTANTPLLGEITTAQNRGAFISQVWLNFNFIYVITLIALTAILRHWESVTTFQWIFSFGVLAGIFSSFILFTIPESSRPRQSGRQPLIQSFRSLWKNARTKKLFFAWSAAQISLMLMIPFSLVALKNGYGIPDHHALIFIIIQLSGGILVSFLNGLILDRVGPRPMIIIYSFSLILNSVLWFLAPDTVFTSYLLLIFLINGICTAGINSALSHYFLIIIPENERVNANMFYSMSSGFITGIAGTILGGGLLKLIHIIGFEQLAIYRRYFAITFVINIALYFLIRRIDRLEDWKIRDVLGIFISFRDIRALFTLSKLASSYSFRQDYSGVRRLRELPSDLSEKQLLAFLRSPRFAIRSKALSALGNIKFSKATARELIREVERGKFTTAYIAAEILGEHRIKEAIPALRRCIDSDDLYLQGKALVALAQLEDRESFPKIACIFDESTNPRIVLHAGRALAETREKKYAFNLLSKLTENTLPEQIRDELLFDLAELAECEEKIYRFLKSYRENPEQSQMILIDILQEYEKKSNNHLAEFITIIEKISWSEFCQCQPVIQVLKNLISANSSLISQAIFHFLNKLADDSATTEIIYSLVIIAAHEIVFSDEK